MLIVGMFLSTVSDLPGHCSHLPDTGLMFTLYRLRTRMSSILPSLSQLGCNLNSFLFLSLLGFAFSEIEGDSNRELFSHGPRQGASDEAR